MQTSTVLVAILFALTSFPFLGQSSPQDNTPAGSGVQQQTAPPTNPTPGAVPGSQPEQASPAASADTSATATAATPAAPAAEMRPVSAELVNALDSKTAKAGDSVVVQTKAAVKTADGTEIPKGTKLVGRVVGVQASTAGDTSQVALQFDHAELVGGQNVPIQSQIQSVGSSDASASSASPMSGPRAGSATAGSTGADTTSPSASSPSASSSAGSAQTQPGSAPGAAAGSSAGAASGAAAPGTVVAKTGQIDIRTTSIPGVLLANNQPGQQDPRMAHASSVLLGAHKDVQLSGGTPLVVGVATTAGAAATK